MVFLWCLFKSIYWGLHTRVYRNLHGRVHRQLYGADNYFYTGNGGYTNTMGKNTMKRTIKNPHWTNNARTVMSAEFHYDDGRVLTAVINGQDVNNPDWNEITRQFSTEALEELLVRALKDKSGEGGDASRGDKRSEKNAANGDSKREKRSAARAGGASDRGLARSPIQALKAAVKKASAGGPRKSGKKPRR